MIKGVSDENFNQNHGGPHSGSSNTPYTEDEQVAIHFELRDSTFRNVSATQAAFASGMKEEHVHRTGQEIEKNMGIYDPESIAVKAQEISLETPDL